MSDIALSKNSMMFVTQEGEGFSGVWAGEYKKYGEKKGEEFRNMAYWIIKLANVLQLQLFHIIGLVLTCIVCCCCCLFVLIVA